MTLVSNFTFTIDLRRFRERGVIPRDTPDPYFHLPRLDYVSTSPLEDPLEPLLRISCTPDELDRWRKTENVVLAALRQAEAELLGELDGGAKPGPELLRDCRAKLTAIASQYEHFWKEISDRMDETLLQEPKWPVVRPDTPERRAQREYNQKYGGGYSSG
ncbi:hypothetical protein [Amycolatopsis palatopharyngis]|uniref:hypothetical protein n=1 Tax=Amycolatopsis palatopharyngis TaxID=187982 RepID=UPI000E23F282|nr:hypothetical protein [Amycolatopsis palatopharyngis]